MGGTIVFFSVLQTHGFTNPRFFSKIACKPTVFWQTHGFSKQKLRPGRPKAKICKFLASLVYFHAIWAIKNDWKHQRWELDQCKVFPLSLANPRFLQTHSFFWKSGCKPTVFTVKPWVEPTVKKLWWYHTGREGGGSRCTVTKNGHAVTKNRRSVVPYFFLPEVEPPVRPGKPEVCRPIFPKPEVCSPILMKRGGGVNRRFVTKPEVLQPDFHQTGGLSNWRFAKH